MTVEVIPPPTTLPLDPLAFLHEAVAASAALAAANRLGVLDRLEGGPADSEPRRITVPNQGAGCVQAAGSGCPPLGVA